MAAQESTASCRICGSVFVRKLGNHIYCGRSCYKRAGYLRKRGPIDQRQCVQCGASIDSPKVAYCSRKCHKRSDYIKRRESIRARERSKTLRANPPVIACETCSRPFAAKRCKSRFCRPACFWKWFRQQPVRRVQSRLHNRKRHAAKAGVRVELVDPSIVFARDEWTCQLCGRKTPQSLAGSRHRLAPTLDHIVPISRGGEHSYRNCQCACLICNIKKHTRVIGQFRLF